MICPTCGTEVVLVTRDKVKCPKCLIYSLDIFISKTYSVPIQIARAMIGDGITGVLHLLMKEGL
jgi:uncharacterized protein (UPF0212 family)